MEACKESSVLADDLGMRICRNCNEIITEPVDNCPRCNAPLEKGGDDAVSDFLKYLGVDEDADDFAKEYLIKEDERVVALRKRLKSLNELIGKTRGNVDDPTTLAEAEELKRRAESAMEAKDMEIAEELVEQSVDKINECSLQYRIMQDTFKATHKKISEAYEMAGDVTRANKLLDKAKELMMELKYDLAISLAIKSRIVADKEKAKYSSFHVGVNGWLK